MDSLSFADHLQKLLRALVGLVQEDLRLVDIVKYEPQPQVLAGQLYAVQRAVREGVL